MTDDRQHTATPGARALAAKLAAENVAAGTARPPTFKRGDEIEVWGMDFSGADTWEPATIVRRERQGIGATGEWYIVRFADGGSLCIHADRMRLRAGAEVPPAMSWEQRVRELEAEGLDRSDAQAAADVEAFAPSAREVAARDAQDEAR